MIPSPAAAILRQIDEKSDNKHFGTPYGTISLGEFSFAVQETALALRERYATSSAPILIVMGGDPWTAAALLAADLAGRTAVLVDAAATSQDVAGAAAASRASLLVRLAPLSGGPPLDGDGVHMRGCLSFTPYAGTTEAATERLAEAPRGMLCHRTSGTKGPPKLALRSGAAIMAELESLLGALELTDRDVVLCTSAVAHSYGCVGGMLAPLLAGASLHLARNAGEIGEMLAAHQPTIVFGLGPQYAAFADGTLVTSDGLGRVRFAFSAGAPLPAGLVERFHSRFGVPIRQDYGTTETGTISVDVDSNPHPETVGTPLPHVKVRLRRPDTIPLEEGEAGEIVVRTRALASGYLADGSLVPCADAAGWYATEDAGTRIGNRLQVRRRLRPLAVVGEQEVNLDRLEREIAKLPGVLEVAVSLEVRPDGSRLVAQVASHTLTADDVSAWCSQHLRKSWQLAHIVMCDRLPRSPAGKLLHRYD